jgi:hypothetical protein
MTLLASRRALAIVLLLLAGVALLFYYRQNAGLQTGGGISLPKMLWLTYAIAGWFVLPFFLWRDVRLEAPLRRMFGVFWLLMVARGAIELPLLYFAQHWNPLYGISHDVVCMAVILALRRGVVPADTLNRRARRYSTSLLVGLVAEVCFAAMFLQTRAHEMAVYFASSGASWGYINFVTSLVLVFVWPDLLMTLGSLYFPGLARETPRPFRWARVAGAFLVVLIATAALGFWTHMMNVEAEGARFQRVGYEIVDSCVKFKDAFSRGDAAGMADFVASGDGSWRKELVVHPHPFELKRWKAGGPPRTLRQAVADWRAEIPTVLQAAFKMHLIDEIVSDTEAVGQLRFEVTGVQTTDYGLLRCRFKKGDDGRWRVVESALVEGTSVKGPGTHFVDVAQERGLDFVAEPDRRFAPGAVCSCKEEEEGKTRLRFQTMRHAYAGCATADYDGDGHDDILFCSGGRLRLFRNRGDGTFEETTKKAGLDNLWHVNTAAFADLDNDGHQDLVVSAFYGKTQLFRNNGDGTFTDVTSQSGIRSDNMVTCICFFDYNNDGRLDLYLGRYLDARTQIPDSFLYARNGEPNVLYRNEGNFRFTDVTDQAGVGERGLTLSVAAADYDGDGHVDLFVANDFGRSVLYKNMGDGTFRDVTLETGCLAIGGNMSASWGDYDNDGKLDLYVGAIRSNQRWFVQPITAKRVLYKYIREGRLLTTNPVFEDLRKHMGSNWVNIGNEALAGNYLMKQGPDGKFTNVAEKAGARPAGWYWSCGFFDIHNKGNLDIYATDGWISGPDPYDL